MIPKISMKQKKIYLAPTMDVVEVNLPCSILSASGSVSGQVENGSWSNDDESQKSSGAKFNFME